MKPESNIPAYRRPSPTTKHYARKYAKPGDADYDGLEAWLEKVLRNLNNDVKSWPEWLRKAAGIKDQ